MSNEDWRERVIRMADERGDFYTEVDGYVVYGPLQARGFLDANTLRILADELDRRNAAWDQEVRQMLNSE